MPGIICSDCKSAFVDEFGIFDGPNGSLCRTCFEKKIKKKVQNTLFQYEKREFVSSVISENLLENAIEWIRENLRPEKVFEEDELKSWAEKNGYKSRKKRL